MIFSGELSYQLIEIVRKKNFWQRISWWNALATSTKTITQMQIIENCFKNVSFFMKMINFDSNPTH